MSTSGISGIREKMDREFAAIRADLKRIEVLAAASQGAPKPSPRTDARLDRALALLRELEWSASDAGRRSFTYTPSSGVDPNQVSTFRITAFQGTTSTSPTTLMHDKVTAVVTAAQQLTLDLQRSGSVPYSNILSIH